MSISKNFQSQRDRFIETARILGSDEDEAAFKAKLAQIAKHKPKTEGTITETSEMSGGIEPSSEFDRGLHAFRGGRDVSDNPHPDGTAESADWTHGWYAAEARDKD